MVYHCDVLPGVCRSLVYRQWFPRGSGGGVLSLHTSVLPNRILVLVEELAGGCEPALSGLLGGRV